MSPEEFEDRVKAGEFLEYVKYGSNRYGTIRSEVDEELDAGKSVILEIELEGARNIRKLMPEALLIFIAPPSMEDLRARLAGRNTEVDSEREVRLLRAEEELASQAEFDYIVVNQTVDQAAKDLEKVIRSK